MATRDILWNIVRQMDEQEKSDQSASPEKATKMSEKSATPEKTTKTSEKSASPEKSTKTSEKSDTPEKTKDTTDDGKTNGDTGVANGHEKEKDLNKDETQNIHTKDEENSPEKATEETPMDTKPAEDDTERKEGEREDKDQSEEKDEVDGATDPTTAEAGKDEAMDESNPGEKPTNKESPKDKSQDQTSEDKPDGKQNSPDKGSAKGEALFPEGAAKDKPEDEDESDKSEKDMEVTACIDHILDRLELDKDKDEEMEEVEKITRPSITMLVEEKLQAMRDGAISPQSYCSDTEFTADIPDEDVTPMDESPAKKQDVFTPDSDCDDSDLITMRYQFMQELANKSTTKPHKSFLNRPKERPISPVSYCSDGDQEPHEDSDDDLGHGDDHHEDFEDLAPVKVRKGPPPPAPSGYTQIKISLRKIDIPLKAWKMPGKFDCTICDRKFITDEALERHIDFHDTDQLMHCALCNMAYPQPQYIVHMFEFHGIRFTKSKSSSSACSVPARRKSQPVAIPKPPNSDSKKKLIVKVSSGKQECPICHKEFTRVKTHMLQAHHGSVEKYFGETSRKSVSEKMSDDGDVGAGLDSDNEPMDQVDAEPELSDEETANRDEPIRGARRSTKRKVPIVMSDEESTIRRSPRAKRAGETKYDSDSDDDVSLSSGPTKVAVSRKKRQDKDSESDKDEDEEYMEDEDEEDDDDDDLPSMEHVMTPRRSTTSSPGTAKASSKSTRTMRTASEESDEDIPAKFTEPQSSKKTKRKSTAAEDEDSDEGETTTNEKVKRCLLCKRWFTNLPLHMQLEHPEVAGDKAKKEESIRTVKPGMKRKRTPSPMEQAPEPPKKPRMGPKSAVAKENIEADSPGKKRKKVIGPRCVVKKLRNTDLEKLAPNLSPTKKAASDQVDSDEEKGAKRQEEKVLSKKGPVPAVTQGLAMCRICKHRYVSLSIHFSRMHPNEPIHLPVKNVETENETENRKETEASDNENGEDNEDEDEIEENEEDGEVYDTSSTSDEEDENAVKCPNCPLVFADRPSYTVHSVVHTDRRSCPVCRAVPDNLKTHLESCAKGMIRVVKSKGSSTKHAEQKQDEKKVKSAKKAKESEEAEKLECEECHRTFRHAYQLKEHELTHEEDEFHVCDMCDQRFKKPRRLYLHKVHVHGYTSPTERKPAKKLMGPKSARKRNVSGSSSKSDRISEVSSVESLETAIKHKSDNKESYPCDMCSKTFSSRLAISQHRKTHTQHPEKPFKCGKCGAGFGMRRYLKAHEQKVNCVKK